MRFLHRLVVLALLASCLTLPGQTPDNRYVRAYSLLEEGDKLNVSGQTRAAVNKFLEAQVAIKDLQRLYPNWNQKILAYRLQYIATKLESLTASSQPAATAEPAAEDSVANQLKKMQENMSPY